LHASILLESRSYAMVAALEQLGQATMPPAAEAATVPPQAADGPWAGHEMS
jgi:hypothetical protein